jgi:hypothetical protein
MIRKQSMTLNMREEHLPLNDKAAMKGPVQSMTVPEEGSDAVDRGLE